MHLVSVTIHNFRGYKNTKINIDDQLTTLIGKNDVGKSTIVDALEIFFNNTVVKLDTNDLNIYATDSKLVSISCEFSDIPESIIIDSNQQTNLKDEYLVNANGNLEIKKVYDCSKKTPKPQIFAVVHYPDNPEIADLLYLTHSKLLTALKKLPPAIQETVTSRVANAPIRQAIRSAYNITNFLTKDIDLQKVDGKTLWDKIETCLPIYALFQSDRPSNDSDAEVQDPMNTAIQESLSNAAQQLQVIQQQVIQEVTAVAEMTISKLKEMDPEIAKGLEPQYQESPKWNKLFKFVIADEKGIPLNKRGSGVRRLVLLNFFRAKVSMTSDKLKTNGLIYAVEEPETAQHPDNQRKIMKALLELGQRGNCQIIITTHLAETAKMAPKSGVRLITRQDNVTKVSDNDTALKIAAKEVGLIANITDTNIVLYVEGPSDVLFFNSVSKILNQFDSTKYSDFTKSKNLLIVPMGGGTMKQWVNYKYLETLQLPSFYLFDKDLDAQHQREVDELKTDPQCLYAFLTDKREIENYIAPAAIERYFSKLLKSEFSMPELNSESDVTNLLKKAGVNQRQSYLKETLNSKVAAQMTADEFLSNDTTGFMAEFIAKITKEIS